MPYILYTHAPTICNPSSKYLLQIYCHIVPQRTVHVYLILQPEKYEVLKVVDKSPLQPYWQHEVQCPAVGILPFFFHKPVVKKAQSPTLNTMQED